jgi:RNA polymerase sigma factor (sigma-70 family)
MRRRFARHVEMKALYAMPVDSPPQETMISPPALDALVANHRAFLAFVERRIGNRAVAEEIVQDAFVRSLDRGAEIRDSVVGWFYRVLRNAVVDHQRRQAVANRRLDQFAAELASNSDAGDELARIACGCVADLANLVKPDYADALRSIEVDGVSVKDYADARGISANNAGVRIFRARQALRKQVVRSCGTCADHGCLDCSCPTVARRAAIEPRAEQIDDGPASDIRTKHEE